MDQLKEHPQIVELLDTLDKNGLMKEKNEVQSLVSYIGGMEETLTGMLGELQDMRREINLIHNNTLRSKCHTLVEKTESKIRQGFSAVKKMKDNLIQSAGNAVRAFREKGRDAIAESVRAMKIPEALDKLSSMFGKLSKDMAQDTRKLSAMQTELQGAKGHLKNMGLLFMGKAAKEAEHSKSDKGVLSRLSRLFEKAQKAAAQDRRDFRRRNTPPRKRRRKKPFINCSTIPLRKWCSRRKNSKPTLMCRAVWTGTQRTMRC